MVNKDGAWSLWLLPTGPTLETGNRGPQSLARPVWAKAVIPRILSCSWVLLGLGSSSVEPRRYQSSINIQQMATLRQTFNGRVWDLKDEAWERGFHPAPPLLS